MPSTTPDLRTVTGGGSSLRATGVGRSALALPVFGSANVDGARALRRAAGSRGRERSGFGQASSKVAGGGSVDSAGRGGGAGGGPGLAGGAPPGCGLGAPRFFPAGRGKKTLRVGLSTGAPPTGLPTGA